MTRTSFRNYATNGKNGSLSIRVGRIRSPVRTFWRNQEEGKDDTMEEEPVNEWWERENMGYTEGTEREPEFIGMMKSETGQ